MPYLKLFQKKLSGSETFNELQQVYEHENLFFPMGWLKSDKSKGYVVENVIYADYLSQVTWALENGCEDLVKHHDFLDKIIIEQINKFEADLVFFNTGSLYRVNKGQRNRIRSSCSSVRAITGSWGDELPEGETYKSYLGDLDLIFACTLGYYNDIKKEGMNVSYLPSSFNEYISYEKAYKKVDVSFIGATGYLELDHFERYQKLDQIFQLLKDEKINFSLVTKEKSASLISIFRHSKFLLQVFYILPEWVLKVFIRFFESFGNQSVADSIKVLNHFKRIGLKEKIIEKVQKSGIKNSKLQYYLNSKKLSSKYRKYYSPPYLHASDYYNALSASKIILNLHRDEENDFGNIRCFEAAGVGSCLVTDRASKMSNLFDVGEEIEGFNSPQDCIDKIKKLLADPERLNEISRKAQLRVKKEHNQSHRDEVIIRGFLDLIESTVDKRPIGHFSTTSIFIYDLRKYPLSYDYIFFLQYCHIRSNKDFTNVVINLILPKMHESKNNSDWTNEEFVLRKTRIINQLNSYFRNFEFIETIDSYYESPQCFVVHKKDELPHHSEYYKYVNNNSHLINPLHSRIDSQDYIDQWKKLRLVRPYITFTIRESKVSTERNTDIDLLKRLASHYINVGYEIVVIPDTNSLSSINQLNHQLIKIFPEAAYDFDLRLALYEKAELNFFNNNGPCIAAGLDPEVSYLLTKLVVPSVPHCTVEFIERQGYRYGATPEYSKNSIWIWDGEDYDLILENAKTLIG